jgi:hypothetical protein
VTAISLLVLVAGAVVIIALFPTAGMLALIVIADLFATANPPAIFAGQLKEGVSLSDWSVISQQITEEVRRQFPNGSDAAQLKLTLMRQGFRAPPAPPANCIPPDQAPIGRVFSSCLTAEQELQRNHTLQYTWGHFPCGNWISVLWQANSQDHITQLRASYRYVCL